ncbi:hypothetical protein C0Q57_30815 [Streptomyces albidoflavus]|nr:hypothetical protein C0Q57_30815 [Streptomyces albidoflavus]
MSSPVHLSDLTLPIPKPSKGCDVCGALMTQWRKAAGTGAGYDPTKAEECYREIANHPHRKGAA